MTSRRFNSKLVRLKDSSVSVAGFVARKFQFQTGAIKRQTADLEKMTTKSCFNSKLVRLKGRAYQPARRNRLSFNSKLVRLKVRAGFVSCVSFSCFNSKLVRLKEHYPTQTKHPKNGFNSKLVRLKVAGVPSRMQPNRTFQFQTGAIKRTARFFDKNMHYPRFNSKLVRLKVSDVFDDLSVSDACFNSKLVRLKV